MMNIFLTPLLSNYFLVFISLSLLFGIETTLINIVYDEKWWSFFVVIQWVTLMFLSSYSFRRVLTQFFLLQTEAEKTRDSLTQILNNLPDAVIMIEGDQLQYCNE